MLESLAADSGNAKLRYETAVAILDVPLTHPLRWIEVERSGSAWWLLKDRTPETPQGEIRMADVILDYADMSSAANGSRTGCLDGPRTSARAPKR